jgi:signal transduction histidine kinase
MLDPAPAPARFSLLRFYTTATLFVFLAVLVALALLQKMEEDFFAGVQRDQQAFFARAQAELARQNEQAARASLLAVHEASHVNLTRLVANTMWDGDFAPLVAGAQRFDVEPCRAMPAGPADAAVEARRACVAELGRRIRALPGFAALDRKAYAAMRASSVFKIKVFDLRGVTVYSSEHRQIGEDGVANQGWRSAAAGRPASELTHRDRFSAFEGVVENRDLISTYVPVRGGPGDAVVGVVELYSDVTPFLAQIQAASRAFAANIAANEARLSESASANQRSVDDSSDRFLLVVGGLIALLYAASLLIVRAGQRLIDRQTLAQEQAAAREQLWHREKMAALAALAANVSHEVGNPLAVIAGLAQQMPEGGAEARASRQILAQTERIVGMVRKISDFAGARSEATEWVEINPMVQAVCEFQAFDWRFRRKPIHFDPGPGLPACELVPDHLNEVMMNLLQASADVAEPEGRERAIHVATRALDGGVCIELGCRCPASGEALPIAYVTADLRFDAARRRVGDMGGRLEVGETLLRILLPPAASADRLGT